MRRDSAEDEISRDDPRFKCRMCGNPIYGVMETDKSYDTTFYCSKDCQLAHWFYCIACLNVMFLIPSGWFLAFLISGVPVSMLLLVTGILIALLILNFVGLYQTTDIWDKRKQIIKNKLVESDEPEFEI